MVTHGTPAALVCDARSDRLKMSERAVLKEVMLAVRASASGPRAVTFKRMGQEDPRAYQTHQCRNRLDHRKIPNPALACEKTRAALHSQKNSSERRDNGGGVRIWRNRMSGSGTEQAGALRRSTGRSEPGVYHLRAIAAGSPFPPCSGCDIVTTSESGGGPPRCKGPDSAPPSSNGLGMP